MLDWLIVLVLLALVVCLLAPPLLTVVAAIAAVAVTTYCSAPPAVAESDVAAGFAGDAAHSRGLEDQDRGGCAEGAGCTDRGSVTAVEPVAVVPDLRTVGVVGPAEVGSLTVARTA